MQVSSVNTNQALIQQKHAEASSLAAGHSEPVVKPAIDAVPVAQDAVQAVDPKAQAEQVAEAVKKINETIKSMNKDVGLEFSTDQDTGIRVVKLIDTQSKDVLRQIPNEEAIMIAKAIDKLQGLLVKDKA